MGSAVLGEGLHIFDLRFFASAGKRFPQVMSMRDEILTAVLPI
jgi:hypothetical protein